MVLGKGNGFLFLNLLISSDNGQNGPFASFALKMYSDTIQFARGKLQIRNGTFSVLSFWVYKIQVYNSDGLVFHSQQ